MKIGQPRVRLGSRLGLVLILITFKMFTFNLTQLKVNQDFENNIWRHLLNILNDIIVEVLRFSFSHYIRDDVKNELQLHVGYSDYFNLRSNHAPTR